MRKIQFRGKRLDNGKWIKGQLLITKYNALIVTGVYHMVTDYSCEVDHVFEVYPETVGQFTGLLDKKGVEIFEGDYLDNGKLISFIDGCFFSSETPLAICCEHRLVISNIHDK
jgi:uncharacterized phage protein (TIGR01671 family)